MRSQVDDPHVTVTVTVTMDAFDFERLSSLSMEFNADADSEWAEQVRQGRFRPYRNGPVRTGFAWGYWFEQWADVMLARSYLEAVGEDYQIVDDEWTPDGLDPYVILTDFTRGDEM